MLGTNRTSLRPWLPAPGPEIAIVSVVSPDDSTSGYDMVPLAIADGNVMFPLGVGNGTVFEVSEHQNVARTLSPLFDGSIGLTTWLGSDPGSNRYREVRPM